MSIRVQSILCFTFCIFAPLLASGSEFSVFSTFEKFGNTLKGVAEELGMTDTENLRILDVCSGTFASSSFLAQNAGLKGLIHYTDNYETGLKTLENRAPKLDTLLKIQTSNSALDHRFFCFDWQNTSEVEKNLSVKHYDILVLSNPNVLHNTCIKIKQEKGRQITTHYEETSDWNSIITNALHYLKPKGLFVILYKGIDEHEKMKEIVAGLNSSIELIRFEQKPSSYNWKYMAIFHNNSL